MTNEQEAKFNAIARDLGELRKMLQTVIYAMNEAESEIPEKMRRFMQYMHAIHDIRNMYIEQGHPAPHYIDRELERLDDRYRQLLEDLNTDTGAFEKVRRDMTTRGGNRWDHTYLLTKEPKA